MLVTSTDRKLPSLARSLQHQNKPQRALSGLARTTTALGVAIMTALPATAAMADTDLPTSGQPIWYGGIAIDGPGAQATQTTTLNLTRGHAALSVADTQHGELSVLRLSQDDAFDSRGGAELEQTQFSLTQRAGAGFLHFGSQASSDEYRVNSGFSVGRALFMANVASGDSATQLDKGSFGYVDPFFFHGGRYQSFRSRSAALAFDLNESMTAHVSHLAIESPGVDKRSASTFGITSSKWHTHAMHVQRGDDTVGHGLDLGFSMGKFDTKLQGVQTSTDAYTSKLSLGYFNDNDRYLQLQLQRDKNPLFAAGDDTRVVFSVSGLFGARKANLFNANEEAEVSEEEDEARRRNRKTLMVAGIAVGAAAGIALASSSGDDDDDNPRFSSDRSAARSILSEVNPKSVRENREYGGWIYRLRGGSFSYTSPNKGDNDSVPLQNPSSVPGTTVATYHTHAAFDPRYDNENFSPADRNISFRFRVNGYLATPGGRFKFFNWRTNTQTTIGRIRTR